MIFAKIIILIFAYHVVSQRIFDESSYGFFLEQLELLQYWAPLVVLILLSLTALNWFFEIWKWQTLARLIVPISFFKALKQSLASLTVSLVTPNRIGEYGAKALYFASKDRSKVVLYNFIGNFNQMATTIVFGSLGFLWVYDSLPEITLNKISWLKTGLVLLTGLIGFIILNKMWKVFYSKLIADLNSVPLSVHFKVFSLSLLKYIVFSHQFYFLMFLFGVDLGYLECMSLLSLSYLISSMIPGFLLFDWLVKGSVAVAIFSRFGIDEILILSITSVMWLLNFGIPSLVGTIYVLAFEHPRTRTEKSPVAQKSPVAEKPAVVK